MHMKLAYIYKKIEPKHWDSEAYANCRLISDTVEKEGMKLLEGTGNMEIWKHFQDNKKFKTCN